MGHVLAERADAAGVAALAYHVVKPRGAKTWIALERLLDEADEGVDPSDPQYGSAGPEPAEPQDPHDDLGMHAKLGRDRPHPPMLGVMKTSDLRFQILFDGHGTPRRHSWCSGPKAPRPLRRRPRRGVDSTTVTSE